MLPIFTVLYRMTTKIFKSKGTSFKVLLFTWSTTSVLPVKVAAAVVEIIAGKKTRFVR